MKTNHRWARGRAPVGAMVVTALLVMAGRPGAAQQPTSAAAQDSTPLTLILVVFPDTTAAQSAMTSLNSEMGPSQGYQAAADSAQPANSAQPAQNVQWIEPYYAIASRAKDGKTTVKNYGQKRSTAQDARAQQSIDGVSALLGDRQHAGAGQAGGAGASRAGVSSANMTDMQNGLQPGDAGLIIVVAEPMVDDVTSQMKQAHASGVYDAPLAPTQ